jgi:hypothetical protein
MPGPETLSPAPAGSWRADTLSGNDMVDLSGNARTLTGSTSSFGTTSLANGWGIAGKAVAVGNGFSAYWSAASAAPWKFLHDGSGATILLTFRPIYTGTAYTILDTGAFVPTGNCGIFVRYDSVLERVCVEFSDGTNRVIDYFLTTGGRWSSGLSCRVNKPHALAITISAGSNPNVEVWLDGRPIDRLNVDDRQRGSSVVDPEPRTFGTGGAGFPLRFMAHANSAIELLQGEQAEAHVFPRVLTGAELTSWWAWNTTTYGFKFDASAYGVVLFDGNSRTDSIWRAGGWTDVAIPFLYQPGLFLMRAIAGMTLTQQIARVAKQVTPFFDSSRLFNIAVVWGDFINEIVGGTTKETCLANYLAKCAALRAQGWKVVGPTEPPSAGLSTATTDFLSAGILASVGTSIDACARLDQVSQIGNASFATDYNGGAGPKLIWSDGTHFTASANANYVAPPIAAAVNSFLTRRRVLIAA